MLALVVAGSAGVAAELGLLGHYEDWSQRIPLLALGAGAAACALAGVRPTRASLRVLQGSMTAFAASGFLGVYFHLRSNFEFEAEMLMEAAPAGAADPSFASLGLVAAGLRGALPALAPLAMLQLGLLGLLACWRHPVLSGAGPPATSPSGAAAARPGSRATKGKDPTMRATKAAARSGPWVLIATCAAAAAPAPAGAQAGESRGVLNANLATAEQLAALPVVGAALAEAIVEARPFLRVSALHEVVAAHSSEDDFDAVYRAVWVPIDLNDAADAEILLIPGVGARMLHEFEEYRPYRALAEFHREIGKYVDDDELARLAQYVYVRIDLNTASEEAILSIPGVGARMLHEFEEYRPYRAMAEFRREIGKYVDDDELARLARYVEVRQRPAPGREAEWSQPGSNR